MLRDALWYCKSLTNLASLLYDRYLLSSVHIFCSERGPMMLLVGMLSAGFSLGVAVTLFIFKPDEKGEA